MTTSDARIKANQMNAQLSTGPKTPEGKAISRQNAVKHGLTGEGVALPNENAEEVERLFQTLQCEMKPSSELGRSMVRRIALHSVRMDRCVLQETAAISVRVRQAEADFVPPEGASDAEIARGRAEAAAVVMFDPSKEASLARHYEAAAERGLFRALKEFRQIEKDASGESTAEAARAYRKSLGSFVSRKQGMAAYEAVENPTPKPVPISASKPTKPARLVPIENIFDVPIAVGQRR